MIRKHNVNVTGPLAEYADHLWENLLGRGYKPNSGRNILRIVAQLSRWAMKNDVSFLRFRREDLSRFFVSRRRAGCQSFICNEFLDAALGPLEKMRAIRWVKAKSIRLNAFERLFSDYDSYLLKERALMQKTVKIYVKFGQRFLAKFHDSSRLDLRRLKIDDITSFILKESRQFSIGTAKYSVTAIRALLHFLFRMGKMSHDLSSAVPAIAGWRMSGLPKTLDHKEVKKLLEACDRHSLRGRRDFAILLLMTRLGLRAGEVARLSLDDIDWRHGEIVIRGKNQRHDRLPLPPDVGTALARHLSDRGNGAEERTVFLRERAPRRGFCVGGIQVIVSACFKRAGFSRGNCHQLRHTAATQILRRGGSLDDVAQVLRHKSHNTTAIYAKVDLWALRGVVMRWPGGAK